MDTLVLKTDAFTLTEDEFFHFCQQNDQLKFERDKDQNIIIMAPTGSISGYYNCSISTQLGNWNSLSKLGFAFDSNSGFTLPNGAMRAPDASWIQRVKYLGLSIDDRKKFAHICPDFIIELKSETDSIKQLKEKMEEWIENGCRLAWLIDIDERKVLIYKPQHEVIEQSISDKLTGEDVLPGFVMNFAFIDEIK